MTTSDFALAPEGLDLLFRAAKTAHAFLDTPVTDDELREVYEIVKWAPTAMNLQPLRVIAVRGAEQEALAAMTSPSNQEKVRQAPVVLIFATDRDFHQHAPELFPIHPEAYDNFEALGREGRDGFAAFNGTLQVGYWVLALRAKGWGVGPMTGIDFPAIDGHFFSDGQLRTLMIATVGHIDPTGLFPRQPRLDVDEVFSTR